MDSIFYGLSEFFGKLFEWSPWLAILVLVAVLVFFFFREISGFMERRDAAQEASKLAREELEQQKASDTRAARAEEFAPMIAELAAAREQTFKIATNHLEHVQQSLKEFSEFQREAIRTQAAGHEAVSGLARSIEEMNRRFEESTKEMAAGFKSLRDEHEALLRKARE